jgi:preprotein translocase subunit SecA
MHRAIAPDQPYFERADPRQNKLDELLLRGGAWLTRRATPWHRQYLRRFAVATETVAATISDLSDAALLEAATTLRARMVHDGMGHDNMVRAFALTREACARQLGLRHYRVQLMGGATMLRRCVAEMETGEGKTITALLPAAALALAGQPVHVVTVNDYLAERDATQLRPAYEALGLTVGLAVHGQKSDERRHAYAQDVTYCTNKDLVFDYLRDRMAVGRHRGQTRQMVRALTAEKASAGTSPLLLRGLHVAIVDEADSILIDEARTPLILAGTNGGTEESADSLYGYSIELAGLLEHGVHWRLLSRERSLELTEEGREELARRTAGRPGLWIARRAREELAERALSALHLFHRDRQYIVSDGKVQIVDEFTGRVMPDRTWEAGLHQMIEAKEGVEITGRKLTLARITYQRFFRRYHHLTGMTGTAAEVAGELAGVYRLGVMRVPTNRPSQRRNHGEHLFAGADDKWSAIVASAQQSMERGQSVLIGTRSVETSEHISELLTQASLPHAVLNARQDRLEAETVAAAGQPKRITVATNMAGRGTDIRLAGSVRAAGGLRVILTEYHESKRIDRQLFGRGGRQGDPGEFVCFAALDDEILARFGASILRRLAQHSVRGSDARVASWLARWLVRRAQNEAGRLHARVRRETLINDMRLETVLAFAGRGE